MARERYTGSQAMLDQAVSIRAEGKYVEIQAKKRIIDGVRVRSVDKVERTITFNMSLHGVRDMTVPVDELGYLEVTG